MGVVSPQVWAPQQPDAGGGPDDRCHTGRRRTLLIHKATGVPVVVGRDRAAAASLLLERHPDIRIVVCDDGLQHHRLARDVEVRFDDRGCGQWPFAPAGPLREPWPRRGVHPELVAQGEALVLHTGHHPAFGGYTAKRELQALARDTGWSDPDPDQLAQLPPSIALAGIAQPDAFFAMLRHRGIPLRETVALPDHYPLIAFQPTFSGATPICTEKMPPSCGACCPCGLAVGLTLTPEVGFLAGVRCTRANRTDCAAIISRAWTPDFLN